MSLSRLAANASVLLLDFDGPVCLVFAGHPSSDIADKLRDLVADRGVDVTGELAETTRCHRVLHLVAQLGDDDLTREIEWALTDEEVTAVNSAEPTPGADEVLVAAVDTGRRVAIVSNNAVPAIKVYVLRFDLDNHIDLVAARDDDLPPALMKPHPHLLLEALEALAVPAERALFVGDSVTDIEAGRAAGVPTIGYANKPGKRARLAAAGADAIIEHMDELAGALAKTAANTGR